MNEVDLKKELLNIDIMKLRSLLKREILSKIKLIAYTDNPILGSIYFNISIFKDMIKSIRES